MDIQEQLDKVKWVDFGLKSGTLWASTDVVIPEGMSADEVERRFGAFLPSQEMFFELYHGTGWIERPKSKRKNYRYGFDVTADSGGSVVFDIPASGEMLLAKDGSCYGFFTGGVAEKRIPLDYMERETAERFLGKVRYTRFRPVKVRKDVIFTCGNVYFVKRRSYVFEGEEITELIFNAFKDDYAAMEKAAGLKPRPYNLPFYLFKDSYYAYSFQDRLVEVNFLGNRFLVRLVRLDRGWFQGNQSYGQEIAELLSKYFHVNVWLDRERWRTEEGLAVCYSTGGRYEYVYDPREFKGGVPSVLPAGAPCTMYPHGAGKNCARCPFFLGMEDEGHVRCSVPGFAWPDEI